MGLIVVGAGSTGVEVAQRTAKVTSVTVVDKLADDLPAVPALEGVRRVNGDATSVLVLREAGVQDAYALLAATSNDEVNIEACRLAVVAGVPEVICRLSDPLRTEEVMALGAKPVTLPMAMAGALTARLPGVAVTTSEVGLGKREILQVRVMAGSLVIGRPLHEIATRAFLVAAIYRGGELIVPHGDTQVEADDQVLLVGKPDTLHAIADYFRLGAAQFPRQFGRTIVMWNPDRSATVEDEAQWLSDTAHVHRMYRVVAPGREESPAAHGEAEALALGSSPGDPLAPLVDAQPGIYVLAPPRRGLLGGMGRLGPLGPLLDRATSPILLARGTAPYRRILVPITDSPTSWRGLELAVDIARLVDARITALHVTQPRFIAGSKGEERTAAVERSVEQVARLYDLQFEVRFEEGNSIRKAAEIAAEHQLVVAARRVRQPDSYFRPDVGLRIALAASCSAVLLNVY